MHEAQLREANSFVTLTLDDEHIPPGGTLQKKHFQDFAKRLRKGRPALSYYHCGEYGEKKRRPHYHAILFGVRFADQRFYSTSADGHVLYTSDELASLWPLGFSTVGEVTFESAAYVARYTMKKHSPKMTFFGEHSYEHIDPETGEWFPVQPEYATMSNGGGKRRGGGIAKGWYQQFRGDVFPSDEVVLRGRVMKPPKYYDKLLELEDPESFAALKLQRLGDALERAHDNTSRRLREREEVKIAQTKTLKRGLE